MNCRPMLIDISKMNQCITDNTPLSHLDPRPRSVAAGLHNEIVAHDRIHSIAIDAIPPRINPVIPHQRRKKNHHTRMPLNSLAQIVSKTFIIFDKRESYIPTILNYQLLETSTPVIKIVIVYP